MNEPIHPVVLRSGDSYRITPQKRLDAVKDKTATAGRSISTILSGAKFAEVDGKVTANVGRYIHVREWTYPGNSSLEVEDK